MCHFVVEMSDSILKGGYEYRKIVYVYITMYQSS